MTVRIRGKLYDGHTAAAGQDVEALGSASGQLTLVGQAFGALDVSEIHISERLAAIPRTLSLPSGHVFESSDNDTIDHWLQQCGQSASWRFRLESNWSFALIALAIVSIVVFASARWGIPLASDMIAERMPAEVDSMIARGALDALDEAVFEETALSDALQSAHQTLFKNLEPSDGEATFKIEFRGGGWIGANAFALPDGTVVVTDELIALSKSDDEISSVILHEMGHVIHRHSLRQVIRHSWLTLLSLLIVGDVSSAGALVLALPSVLVQSAYSREFETEADDYALMRMQELDIKPINFANLMQRMERCALPEDEELQECREAKPNASLSDPGKRRDWLQYLSTHPATLDRLTRFKDQNN
jgi:Zn-dependent protease with chaperone function